MNNLEEKCLRFVLRYYQKNKMNTQKALEAFKNKHQIAKHDSKPAYIGWLVSGAIAAMLIGFLIYPQFRQDEQWKTIAAEKASVSCTLPDGSSVTLYPNSYIQFRENKEWLSHREVRMRGKARFSVRHDAARPFTVEGLLARVKVLGTAFTVDESRKDTAIVKVESGKVQFSAVGRTNPIILTKDMTAQLTKNQDKPQIVKQPATGSFIFDNAPLPKVLEELSRYYKVKLSASNENKRLTASFKNKSLDEIIRFIEKVLDVKIEKVKQ